MKRSSLPRRPTKTVDVAVRVALAGELAVLDDLGNVTPIYTRHPALDGDL